MEKLTIYSLEGLSIFHDIKVTTLSLLVQKGVTKNLEKGQHLFFDKDKIDSVYILLQGKVSVYKISETGQKKVAFILDRGNLINEVALDDLPASINAEVFEECKVLVFKKSDFLDIMEKDFNLTRNVLNSLSLKMRRLYRQIKNNPSKIEKRLAAKLWKLARDYGIEVLDGTLIDLNITVTYLGDMLGCARETTSRGMKKLEELNLIRMKERKILVPDMDILAKYFKSRD